MPQAKKRLLVVRSSPSPSTALAVARRENALAVTRASERAAIKTEQVYLPKLSKLSSQLKKATDNILVVRVGELAGMGIESALSLKYPTLAKFVPLAGVGLEVVGTLGATGKLPSLAKGGHLVAGIGRGMSTRKILETVDSAVKSVFS